MYVATDLLGHIWIREESRMINSENIIGGKDRERLTRYIYRAIQGSAVSSRGQEMFILPGIVWSGGGLGTEEFEVENDDLPCN